MTVDADVAATATPDDEPVRRRLVLTLFGANALSSTAFIGVITVAPILAEGLTGSEALAGLPSTAATVGTAAGALALAALGARRGRRPSFTLGFGLAAVGAAAAVAAVAAGSFLALAVGLFVMGFGRSASQLARYAAGDLREEDRRGRAISVVVWASTVGAVAGPLLIAPAGRVAERFGLVADVGAAATGATLFALGALAMLVLLRPDPMTLAVRDPAVPAAVAAREPVGGTPLRELMWRPNVRLSVAVLVTSQLVMVMVMTMTPLHIRGEGLGLSRVGEVMSGHTLGMFALAPVTGWLVDRVGQRRVMVAGGVVLLASCVAAAGAGGADRLLLVGSLWGLGFGWNLGFVAASSHLQVGLRATERARVQGVADATTWIAGGLGAAVSGTVVAATSYGVLATTGAVLALMIPTALAANRLAPAPA